METKSMNVIGYVAPEVEVLEVKVETGFEASATDPSTGGGGIDLPDE